MVNLEIVKNVLSSVKEEQEFLENCGMSVDSELKTYSYYKNYSYFKTYSYLKTYNYFKTYSYFNYHNKTTPLHFL